MSRPQKLHKPIKASFTSILFAISAGTGKGKKAANKAKKSAKPAARKREPVH